MNRFTFHMLFYGLLSYNYSPQTPPMETALILPSSGCCHRVSYFPSYLPLFITLPQYLQPTLLSLLFMPTFSLYPLSVQTQLKLWPFQNSTFETLSIRRLLSVWCSSSRQSGELTLRNHEPLRPSDLQLPGLRLQPSHRRGQVALELPGLLPAVAPESTAGVTGVTAW